MFGNVRSEGSHILSFDSSDIRRQRSLKFGPLSLTPVCEILAWSALYDSRPITLFNRTAHLQCQVEFELVRSGASPLPKEFLKGRTAELLARIAFGMTPEFEEIGVFKRWGLLASRFTGQSTHQV
jgi:hypothetical protein